MFDESRADIIHRTAGQYRQRTLEHNPGSDMAMSDALDTTAREHGHRDWMEVNFADLAMKRGRNWRAKRLKTALYFGQDWVVRDLLALEPDLRHDDFGLEVALYDETSVRQRLAEDPGCAVESIGPRRPILHLAFSRRIQDHPELEPEMLAIAAMLVEHGASVNDSYPFQQDSPHRLSALYGAIGHAGNIALGRWLLEHGADPDDNESLYHSTEIPGSDATRLLLQHGARIDGTNALLRALDFNDHETVGLLLEYGANATAQVSEEHPSGEPSMMIPALHQAARRMADAEMARLLIEAGADVNLTHDGHTPYAIARIYGNGPVAEEIEKGGGNTQLDGGQLKLAQLAGGQAERDQDYPYAFIAGNNMDLLTNLIQFPDKLDHVKRLVEFGFDHNATDKMDLTPLHIAGWEGLPETMAWLLEFKPDLDHINGYGGDLLSTIIHGSENCPNRESRDHIACARLALEAGVALGTDTMAFAGEWKMAEFLVRWSSDHPDQVVQGGIA